PLVVPVAGPLLVRRAAARPHRPGRLGDLAARREDGVALLLRDRSRSRGLFVRTAPTQEEREAGGAGHVTDPSRGQAAALGRVVGARLEAQRQPVGEEQPVPDRKSTRLNSSHGSISYAVFCLKKQKNNKTT